MLELEFDIAVIGAGPGGSSAAITAARSGAKVGLFEAGEFPRHKVCGEFVSAESLEISSRSCFTPSPSRTQSSSRAPVIDQVRLLLDREMVAARLTPPALSITRYDLDRLLWQAASKRPACRVRSNCEVRAISGAGPFLSIRPGRNSKQHR